MKTGLEGKRALVLGASKGLGFGIAQGLAEEGARVAIASRTMEGSKAAADKIGRDVLPFICDTGKVDQVDALAKATGVSRSDYVRQAVEEKNARALAERVAFLSKALAASHKGVNEELEDSLGDGLAGR